MCRTTRRVTVDIDIEKGEAAGFTLHFYAVRALGFLQEMPGARLRIYRTSHGFHFDIRLCTSLSLADSDDVRRYLGDDERRLSYVGERRRYPEQVLFETRRGFEKVDITEEVMQDLASR